MSFIGLIIIAFGLFIALLSILTRPGTSTKPADRAAPDKNRITHQ